MQNCIGIRRETKDKTQRRSPLSPRHVAELVGVHGLRVIVEPWAQRVFSEREYRTAGAVISEDLSGANIIFGVKEVAPSYLSPRQAYCFFSHTVKGQAYNMPMLRDILEKNISLFDYELVRDSNGQRLIFFGEYAGYAGMIDSLWALGRRLQWERIDSPFKRIRYATKYENLSEIQEQFSSIGRKIHNNGIPRRLVPLVCGFTGYGRVSKAAQEILDLFPTREIAAADLPTFFKRRVFSDRLVYKVQFRKHDMFTHRKAGWRFDSSEFREHPERYRSAFGQYLPYLTILINGIYWEPGFPRLVTKRTMRAIYQTRKPKTLRVIGDITCDVDGSIELTTKTTDESNPIYVYEPLSGKVLDGWKGKGPVILAVDKLPTELPREASESFGDGLLPFVPALASLNYRKPAGMMDLPREFRDALITHRGRLTPKFSYLKDHLISS